LVYLRSIPRQIFPTVYQGSNFTATDTVLLNDLGVTHVIDCCKLATAHKVEGAKYLHVSVDEDVELKCEEIFAEAFAFLGNKNLPFYHNTTEQAEREGVCFIHCALGISSSVFFLIAYLMKYKKWSLPESFFYVEYRGAYSLLSNKLFNSLKNFEIHLFNKPSLPDYGKRATV
jgi:hypothetical protein